MKRTGRRHMVLLGDLEEHSIREVCQGAAEYAAQRLDLSFSPWPVSPGRHGLPGRADCMNADCVLASESAFALVYGDSRRVPATTGFYLGNAPHRGVPCVALDETAIGRMAAEHLLQRGYRHLAFLGSADLRWSNRRGRGFAETAAAAGVRAQSHELPLARLPVYWAPVIEKCRAELRDILRALPKPCGIFACNDVVACFAIETARAEGLGVPDDIGVVGVDNDPVPNVAAGLAISSVEIPLREVGRQAAELLDLVCRGKAPPRHVVVGPVRVVARTSTNAFMIEDRVVRQAQTYIEAHRVGRVRVAEVVKAGGTTAVTLSKHFARHLHTTPAGYILRRLIEYAKELLRAGDLNVEEVARAGGFHSCSYFCDVFRRKTGTSPGSLRPHGYERLEPSKRLTRCLPRGR